MPSTIPAPWQNLLDDAATFPPGDADLDEAVIAHRGHRESPHAALVNSFVVADTDLPRVADAPPGPVSLVITGGAGAINGPLSLAGRRGVELAGVEIALRDPDDLPGNARRVLAALDQAHDEGTWTDETPTYLELPHDPRRPEPSYGWLAAADVAAERELRLKLRTGSVDPDLVPSPGALAAWIDAALAREIPFKCTAGLHHAVRHRDAGSGTPQHGFLNVLLATRAAFDGEPVDTVTEILDQTDTDELLARFHEHGPETMARTRRWFTSFGSCSVAEPLRDLIELSLVSSTDEGEHPDEGGPA